MALLQLLQCLNNVAFCKVLRKTAPRTLQLCDGSDYNLHIETVIITHQAYILFEDLDCSHEFFAQEFFNQEFFHREFTVHKDIYSHKEDNNKSEDSEWFDEGLIALIIQGIIFQHHLRYFCRQIVNKVIKGQYHCCSIIIENIWNEHSPRQLLQDLNQIPVNI
ncbi:hypothetical protein KCU99_g2140, partial [Aureobasidium melanogenum]